MNLQILYYIIYYMANLGQLVVILIQVCHKSIKQGVLRFYDSHAPKHLVIVHVHLFQSLINWKGL